MFGARLGWRSPFLLLLFTFWVLAPFAALAVADRLVARLAAFQVPIYRLMIATAVGSLAAYAVNAANPPQSQPAFAFVMTPIVAWVVILTTLQMIWLIQRVRRRAAQRP